MWAIRRFLDPLGFGSLAQAAPPLVWADEADSRLFHTDSLAGLAKIRDPECKAVILKRSLPTQISRTFNDLNWGQFESFAEAYYDRNYLRVEHGQTGSDLNPFAESQPRFSSKLQSLRRFLNGEYRVLSQAFSDAVGMPHSSTLLRLTERKVVDTYHIDGYAYRMGVTYHGPGTSLICGDMDLGTFGERVAGCTPDSLPEDIPQANMETGDILLFKGCPDRAVYDPAEERLSELPPTALVHSGPNTCFQTTRRVALFLGAGAP